MQRIPFLAELNSATGYGDHISAVTRELKNAGYFPTIRPFKMVEPHEMALPNMTKSMVVYGQQPEPFEVVLSPIYNLPTPGKKTFFWTMWESTRLPSKIADRLNRADVVIVPCQWNATVFSANGVTKPIRVVPLGCDPVEPPRVPSGFFTFSCGGNLLHGRERKSIDRIIRLFRRAFPDRKDVRLQVKVTPACPLPDCPDERVIIERRYLPKDQLHQWFCSSHCFINLATGGWELMPHIAMMLGIPVISHTYGGVAEFFNENNGLVVSHTLVPAKDEWTGHGHWAEADESSVIEAMRWAFQNSGCLPELGRQARKVAAAFTWQHSAEKLVAVLEEFGSLQPKQQSAEQPPECNVLLGRAGDIINLLPLIRYKARKRKQVLIVKREYKDLFEGVSYCQPSFFDGDLFDLQGAREEGLVQFGAAKVVQPSGYGHFYPRQCDAFNMETWRLAGGLEKFGDLWLSFDRRNLLQERAEWMRRGIPSTMVIGLNLTGISSPFADAQAFRDALFAQLMRQGFRNFVFLDIGGIKAMYIHDLLGLIDRCACFITTDTSTLHLSQASATPTIALVADNPTAWNGSAGYHNTIYRVPYAQAMFHVERIATLIQGLPSWPRLIHVFSDFMPKPDAAYRRYELAQKTWRREYREDNWTRLPVGDAMLSSVFRDNKRTLPYVTELLGVAVIASKNDDEIIVLSNSDIFFTPGISTEIRNAVGIHGAMYCYRNDFPNITRELTKAEITEGELYSGCDLFAFTVGWWKKFGPQYPNMLLAAEAWDWCMRVLIDRNTEGDPGRRGLIYHERHATEWETNRLTSPAQKHNRAIGKEFLTKMGVYQGELG